MPDKPAAEVRIDEGLLRALLQQTESTMPGAATRALRKTSEGWDSEVWRLGEDLAVRLPRRAVAAPLVRHEQRALPIIAPRIMATGIRVPLPVFEGSPSDGYPWSWSIVPWFEGTAGIDVPRAERCGWADHLARGLVALHVGAPPDHPVNPVRGVPLAHRADAVGERLAMLRASGGMPASLLDSLDAAWHEGLSAPPWQNPPVWVHGDLHPGNLVADGGRLVAIIDFGDVTAGDPAYDLSVAWLAFDRRGRDAFRTALDGRYDDTTWTRSRGWAAAVAMMLIAHSDDDPAYRRLGAASAHELSNA